MFNKKLVITIVLAPVIFLSWLLGFVVIPNALNRFRAVSHIPTHRDSVSGNGGSAVMVGEYLYFASGFISKESVRYRQNDYNQVRGEGDGGIWRVRMTNGTPEYDNSYINDLGLDDWFENMDRFDRFHPLQKYSDSLDRMIKRGDLQLIVPKVAGWEDTALWVFGNNLIYTTPNDQRNRHGQLRRHRTDFFRVALNGSGHRRIYTTRNDNVQQNAYTVAWANKENGGSVFGGDPYLLVHDGGHLNRVSMNGRVRTISKHVEGAVFPVVTTYISGILRDSDGNAVFTDPRRNLENSYSDMMQYVFYTEAADPDDQTWRGNSLWVFEIASGKKVKLRQDHNNHSLLQLRNGHLMMEISFENRNNARELYVIGEESPGFANFFNDSKENQPWFELVTLNQRFRMQQTLESEEVLYISGERTSQVDFRYLTLSNNRLLVYDKVQGDNYSPREILDSNNNVINDINTIIAVNSGNIMYQSTNNQLVTISWCGTTRDFADAYLISGAVGGARITAFCVLNNQGQESGLGYMFFFTDTISQVLEALPPSTNTGEDGEEQEEVDVRIPDTISLGTVVLPNSSGGRNFLLTRFNNNKDLFEKFVYLPNPDDE